MYACPLSLEPPCHLPAPPTPLGYLRVLDLSSLCHIVNSHWLSNFTHGNVYVSMLLSSFVPPSPPPTVSKGLFSTSVSAFLPCKQVHPYHLSRFLVYRCVSIRYLSFSFSLTSLCAIVGHSFYYPASLASQLYWLPPLQLSSWFTLYSISFFSYHLSKMEFTDYHQST